MAHVVGDKVQQAYDRSEFMIERTKFMIAWCDAWSKRVSRFEICSQFLFMDFLGPTGTTGKSIAECPHGTLQLLSILNSSKRRDTSAAIQIK